MKRVLPLLFLSAALTACAGPSKEAKALKPVTEGAFPSVDLVDEDSKATTVKKVLGGEPTLVVIYRGGWCPYCTKHLSEIGMHLDDLKAKGVKAIAISPDKPAKLEDTQEKFDLGYALYSDSKMALGKKLNLAFTVDGKTRTLYKTYGIDLEEASGETHYQLPVPAAYLIDKEGNIAWAYANANYKTRASIEDLMKAVDKLNAM